MSNEINSNPKNEESSSKLLKDLPSDGISSIAFCSSNDLVVTSWDATVRLYDINNDVVKFNFGFGGALLCSSVSDSDEIFVGGLEANLCSIDASVGVATTLYSHQAAVSCNAYNSTYHTLVSGSWDKTVILYDASSKTKSHSLQLTGKVFSVSTIEHKLVIGTSNKEIIIYDMRNLSNPEEVRESPLRNQIRKTICSPNKSSFAIGSTEGRVAIEYFDMAPEVQAKKYAFKCHRQGDFAFPINAISYHPMYGTFATGGCDGFVNIWDGENRKRLFQCHPYQTSISSLAFNSDGSLLAVASSYTYEQGEISNIPENVIDILRLCDNDVRPKSKT